MAGIVSYSSPMLGKLNGHGFSNSHGLSVWYIPMFLGWLVVLTCFSNLEKYEFVNGKDYPIFCGT